MGKYWDRQRSVKAQNKKTTLRSCLVQPSKISAVFKYTGINTKLVDRVGTRTSGYKLAMKPEVSSHVDGCSGRAFQKEL